jgi:transposase
MNEMPNAETAINNGSKKKRGRKKKTKELNLLERLRDFENDVLRFMDVDDVPFTNNRGENDIRMTKVQQKISGCFKSIEGAKIFCRVRSYLLTCQKHGISPTDSLKLLFSGKLPEVLLAES